MDKERSQLAKNDEDELLLLLVFTGEGEGLEATLLDELLLLSLLLVCCEY